MKRPSIRSSIYSRDDRIFDTVVLVLLVLLTVCFILPFMNIIALSVSDQYAIMRGDVRFWPNGFDLSSYNKLFTTDSVILSYRNTFDYSPLQDAG